MAIRLSQRRISTIRLGSKQAGHESLAKTWKTLLIIASIRLLVSSVFLAFPDWSTVRALLTNNTSNPDEMDEKNN